MRDAGAGEEDSVIPDLDIYRVANLVIKQHGARARAEAGRRMKSMREQGDSEGQLVWQRIKRAIIALQMPRKGPLN
jgi:hypothetical protein